MDYRRLLKPHLGTPLNKGHRLSKGLAGLWLMNEGAGTSAKDCSGHGNDVNFAIASPTWTVGRMGPGVVCSDTTNQYLVGTDFSSLDFVGDFTLVSWFESVDAGTSGFIFKGGNATGYALMLGAGNLRIYANNTFVATAADWNDGNLHMAVGVRQGTVGTLYIDGKYENSGALDGGDTTNTVAFAIGRWTTASYVLDGNIYYTACYNRALTPQEIAELYANPYAMFERDKVWGGEAAGAEATAAYSPASVVLTVPSITATYEAETTAAYTALPLTLTVPAITASYVQEETAAYTPLSLVLAIPSTTVEYSEGTIAAYTPVPLTLTIPAITAASVSELTASFTALDVVFNLPAITASYVYEATSAFDAVSLVMTIPGMTATYSDGTTVNPKVKIGGTFTTKTLKIKLADSFVEKPAKVKVGGVFV